jgi:hypothetical protein
VGLLGRTRIYTAVPFSLFALPQDFFRAKLSLGDGFGL